MKNSSEHRKQGLFLPSEQCLGGAMELNAIYANWLHKIHQQPGRVSNNQSGMQPTAQQLSLQRARKLAQNDSTYYNHLLNLHHMQRRMAEAAGISQPRSPLTQAHNVATADQSSRRRPNSVTLPYCPWLPAAELAAAAAADRPNFRRPRTAPPRQLADSGMSSTTGSRRATADDSRKDWQKLKQKQHPQLQPPVQPVELPPSRFYMSGPNLLPSVQHRLYKASIMSDILERQLYRPQDIRALCNDYLTVNPLEHREVLRQVVAEVQHELHIK